MSKYNLDNILKPYEDEQPKQISVQSTKKSIIERMPPIVNSYGVTEEFQSFFNDVVEAITEIDAKKLWEISDKVLTLEQFTHMFEYNWKDHLDMVIDQDPENRGIDIELNLGRFQGLHRNIIGGFYIMTYLLYPHTNQAMFGGIMNFEKEYTELLFTYKNKKFVIMSKLDTFKSVED